MQQYLIFFFARNSTGKMRKFGGVYRTPVLFILYNIRSVLQGILDERKLSEQCVHDPVDKGDFSTLLGVEKSWTGGMGDAYYGPGNFASDPGSQGVLESEPNRSCDDAGQYDISLPNDRCRRGQTLQGQDVRSMGYLDVGGKSEIGNDSGWKLQTPQLRRLSELGCSGLERLRQVRYKEEGEGTRNGSRTWSGDRGLSGRPLPR